MGFLAKVLGQENNDENTNQTNELDYVDPPILSIVSEELKRYTSLDDFTQNTNSAAALVAAYTETVQSRKHFIQDFNKVRDFYIVEAILNMIAEDVLTPDVTSGEIVNIGSDKEELNEELISLQNVIDFDQILNDIILDLLSYGEYTLRLRTKDNKGVTDIIDDIDQTSITAFYREGFPFRFMRAIGDEIRIYHPAEFVHFCVGKAKLRVRLDEEYHRKVKELLKEKELPEYARIGRPLFYGILSKIKELQLLEQLVPATKLHQMTRGSLVSVQVPQNMSPAEALKVTHKYEQLLNRKTGIDRSPGNLTVQDIINVAGKYKVIPIFGDKGTLSQTDAYEDHGVDDITNSIRDLREVICTSIGIPPELMFGGETKGEILKRYARYLRRLKSIQNSLAMGVRQICLAHLANKGFEVSSKDIDISFRNSLINIDELEKAEMLDVMLTTFKDKLELVLDLAENELLSGFIDQDELKRWIRTQMTLIGKDVNFLRDPDSTSPVSKVFNS